jgi:CelD/BcsL family acetyltransferase involved in cellulose biosynthesis
MEKKELLLSGVNHKLTLRKVSTTQGFRELKEKWNQLLEQSPDPNIFLTWEWLYTWWEFYSSRYQLYILLVLDQNDNPLGIVPLCSTYFSPLKLNTLKFLGTEEVCPDHLDFISKKGEEEKLIQIFLQYLESNSTEWDLIDLTDLREDSLSLPFILNWVKGKNYPYISEHWTVCPYAVLSNNWELFLNGLSANARKDIRRQLRLFEESKDVRHSIVKNKNEVRPAREKLFHLHTKRWTSLGEEGVFQRERFNQFHQKISEVFFGKGWLLLSSLSTTHRNIAIHYDYQFSNKIYAYQSGFDPEWENFSAGTVSLALIIRQAISRGIKEFDFLRGDAPYKYKWTDKERVNLQIRIWNKNLKSSLCRNGLMLISRAKSLTKRYMPDFVIKILKCFWSRVKL